jgi:hypothetical protein
MRNYSLAVSGLIAVAGAGLSTPSHATVASIDEFTVARNGVTFFSDSFDDGLEPPSAPNFAAGGAASYILLGTIPSTAESGGLLQLDTVNGVATVNAVGIGRLETRVRLATNIDDANLAAGLKVDDTLSVAGIFDLSTPTGVLNPQYSVRFTDAASGEVHQSVQLQVIFNTATGLTQIRYIIQDFDADTLTVLGSALLDAPSGADGILLGIDRFSAVGGDFFGSYAYVTGGIVGPRSTFTQGAQMFQGENFVRAEFNVSDGFFVAIPEPSTTSLMLCALGALGMAARRRKLSHADRRSTPRRGHSQSR